ncbi:MAG: hypothetical protein ABEK10_03905 [Candidatus Nanosalina sp.]
MPKAGGKFYTVLLLFGVLTGLQFTYMAEYNMGLPLVDENPIQYGFYMFDYGSSTCRFFGPDTELPENISEFQGRRNFTCTGVWEEYYLDRQISVINSSTNDSEVQAVLRKSRVLLEEDNISGARQWIQRIEVRRSYTIEKSAVSGGE